MTALRITQSVVGDEFQLKVFADELILNDATYQININYFSERLSISSIKFPPGTSAGNPSSSKSGSVGTFSYAGSSTTPANLDDPLFILVFTGSGTGAINVDFTRLLINSGAPQYTDPPSTEFSITPTPATSQISINEDVSTSGAFDPFKSLFGSTLKISTPPANVNLSVESGDIFSKATWIYTPASNYFGQDSFTVTATDGSSSKDLIVSVRVNPVNDAPSGAVAISGTPTLGKTLSAENTLSDPDGLGAISYRWQANGKDITDAAGPTLALTAAQSGARISVIASYVDTQGKAEAVVSAATAPVTSFNRDPGGALTLAGAATQGQQLSATSTLTDMDGLGAIGLRWQLSSNGLTGWYDLAGATGTPFSPSAVQVGLYARAVASYIDALGTAESVASATTHLIGIGLSGSNSADILAGTPGDDRLDGKAGADQLSGKSGDDVYLIDSQADLVFEGADEGTDTVLATASFYLYANIENLTLSGSALFGVGNALANTLIGNDQENLLIGWDGNDTLSGGNARDALFGVDGNDVLRGDAGIDYIVAGSGDDTLIGGADADEMYGQEGIDSLLGGDDFATDILVGGEGNDTLDGGPAWDLMYGGAGDDTYVASQQVDWVFESPGEGNDTVIADSPNGYYLYDNVETLILVGETPFGVGNELGNLITGNAVTNVLLGGAGADTLDGGAGLDILWGQDGADTFRIGKGTGVDIVADFQVGVDKLDLSAFGLSTLAQAKAQMTQVGSDVSVQLGNGDSVILIGVSLAGLTAADFVLGPPGGE